MTISTYYRGGTDRVSGFIFDVESMSYKEFIFGWKMWIESGYPKKGFKMVGDLQYHTQTFGDMIDKLEAIQNLGFIEDKNMILDFGIFVM